MKTTLTAAVAALLIVATMVVADLTNRSTEAQETSKQAGPNITTQVVNYKDGDTECEGFAAWDANLKGKRPVVLIVHDWMGRGEFDEARAKQLAALGYLAFSVDVYGKGVRPTNAGEAGKTAGAWKNDTAALRTRLQAGMNAALALEQADKDRVGAMGYCFGGFSALELARSGADVKGVISFHGSLRSDKPEDAKNIKGKVLVLHGADDDFESVAIINKEMKDAGVDYELDLYGHTVHAFTNPKAGNDPSRGVAYSAQADARSWQRMEDFFEEIFR